MRIFAHRDWVESGRSGHLLKRVVGEVKVVLAPASAEAALGLVESTSTGRPGSETGLVGEIDQISLVGTGRIDNAEELRSALGMGHLESLADLLIRAYAAWGNVFPARVIGDFALVLWDGPRHRMLAVRDAFGTRPLVYRASREGLWIASDVEQILQTLDSAPDVDDQMVV
jgi:asparagine synthetase B (glutamine-hydrolysing)